MNTERETGHVRVMHAEHPCAVCGNRDVAMHYWNDEWFCSKCANARYVLPEKKPTILDEARAIVDGARQSDYGPPEDNFAKIGRVWGALLAIPDIPARTVANMLIGLKIVRDAHFPKRDNMIDAAGYAYAGSLLDGGIMQRDK